MKQFFKKSLRNIVITIGFLLLLMLLLPTLFPGFVANKVKYWANSSITGEVNFSKVGLSFFHHFPSLTLTLYDVDVKGAAPFANDTLLHAQEVSLGINMKALLQRKVKVDAFYVNHARVQVLVDSNGAANYNIYASSNTAATSNDSSMALQIERIVFDDTKLIYNDASLPMFITADSIQYSGKGDLSKAMFDLQSNFSAARFYFKYGGQEYFGNKQLQANLITKINTNSLAFVFEKNDISINKLPVAFKGKFAFLSNGYDMHFELVSKETDLQDVFTALPPAIVQQLDGLTVNGYTQLKASLTGQYIASEQQMPTLAANVQVRNGNINSSMAPSPISHLFLNMNVDIPQCNPDSLHVKIDSIYLTMGQEYLSAIIETKGITNPYINTKLKANIDIEKWTKAMGIQHITAKGLCQIQANANGFYTTAVNPNSIRPDTVITSIPKFNINASISNGYFRYNHLPLAIETLNGKLTAQCNTTQWQDASIQLHAIEAKAGNNRLSGFFNLKNIRNYPIQTQLQLQLNLADIANIIPLQGYDVKGNVALQLQANGSYEPKRKQFPKANLTVKTNNVSIRTPYYPRPIERITIDAWLRSTTGSYKDITVQVRPIAFVFENHPFTLKAQVGNWNNLRYNISSNGIIDIGKIYQVFKVPGYHINGSIATNLSLQGTQADAAAGKYQNIQHKGTLRVQDIVLYSDVFPQPLVIYQGALHAEQDKMVFTDFRAKYGSSRFQLGGYIQNSLGYLLQQKPLQGNLTVKSSYILLDELMAYHQPNSNNTSSSTTSQQSTGVIMLPKHLSVDITGSADKIVFQNTLIQQAAIGLQLQQGILQLNNTGFRLADAIVSMQGQYYASTPTKAYFSYQLQADSFNVQKLYQQVPLFRSMAPAAKRAKGVASLNYQIAGRLNSNMTPILPSIKGGGTLRLERVSFYGFKLLDGMGKAAQKDSLRGSVSGVVIKSTIANNIFTIERVKLKMFGFRPRFEGQISLDGKLNLKARLGLPPLGIFGIPMHISGTREKPIFKLKRSQDQLGTVQEEDADTDAAP